MTTAQPFQLRLLGTPALVAPDGSLLRGRVVQRHRLALLALLARAPDPGLSRDQVTALLWPESDRERARNLLNVSIYVVRRALGSSAITTAGEDVRLSFEIVRADVVELESALARGDRAAAIALYRGPFLDGFFLDDSSEFERWVDRERDRMGASYAGALRALAEDAERGGDVIGAAEWWKRLADHDPYDSRVAVALMGALVASGNRGGAVQYAARHEQLLRDELGIEAAPEVHALAAKLREGALGVEARLGPVRRSAPGEAPVVLPIAPTAGSTAANRRFGARRAVMAAAMAVLGLVAIAVIKPHVSEGDESAARLPTGR